MLRIGITERGDAGLDLSWSKKLDSVDAAILITKNITPQFIKEVIKHSDKKLKVHCTMTGWGGTQIERNVPEMSKQIDALEDLVIAGFSRKMIVGRVDPIIPSAEGIDRACFAIRNFIEYGIKEIRVSIVDMYPHARSRFSTNGIEAPYGSNFLPSRWQVSKVDKMLSYFLNENPNVTFYSCAEPGLTNAKPVGCISKKDLCDWGFSVPDEEYTVGCQRKNCLCYAGKTELLERRGQCLHNCLYCYWK